RKSYSESLKTTLNCYQLSSADSLSGPSSYSALAAQLWFKVFIILFMQENKQSPPIPPPPLIQIPLLMPNDTSTQRSETVLVGERISCFVVGGEKRLCLPQILTSVLREFSISEINRACAELHIYCSRCSPDQLEILKVLGILPFNTTQCGLITKTDAERLVSALGVECGLNSTQDLSKVTVPLNFTMFEFDVFLYHECFGRGDGIFYPELYISPDSPCVACLDCRISFSPSRFVSHSHRGLEKHTCHWGFDPDNWRSYLLVPKDNKCGNQKELESMLKLIKAKFNFDTGSQLRYNR
uniref:c-SKI SMAD4-binding domain-containing protein n=1 Tax=Ciona savignyi TaxID=51511 RepID=H2Y5U3_CIOSA